MRYKTRPEDRNKTVGQAVREDGKQATVRDLQRVSRGQGDTVKRNAKAAKRGGKT